jgi:hypothetical protein
LTPTATSTPALSPVLTVDPSAYIPGQTVVVTGQGFAPDTTYDVPVVRPDGATLKADGSFGWDTVTTDASGAFTYNYPLGDLLGGYTVEVYEAWAGQGSGQVPIQPSFVNVEAASLIVRLAAGLVTNSSNHCPWRHRNLRRPGLGHALCQRPATPWPTACSVSAFDPQVVGVETDKVREAEADPSGPAYPDQWLCPKSAGTPFLAQSALAGRASWPILDTGVDASH